MSRHALARNQVAEDLTTMKRSTQRAQQGRPSAPNQNYGEDDELDAEEEDEVDLTQEMLQRRLEGVTDENEIKRIKRLIRNRVSAQQARERKKQYVSDLESQLQRAEGVARQAVAKAAKLEVDNATLRRIIRTMRHPDLLAGQAVGQTQPNLQAPSGHRGTRPGEPPPEISELHAALYRRGPPEQGRPWAPATMAQDVVPNVSTYGWDGYEHLRHQSMSEYMPGRGQGRLSYGPLVPQAPPAREPFPRYLER